MRIGICAPYDLARDGGVNSHIRAQAQALNAIGHTVRIFGAASAALPVDERSVSGCIAPVIGGTETGMGIDPRAWRRVRALYADERFDLVHVHEPLMPLVPWCAVVAADVPVVATFHTHRDQGHRFYARFGSVLAPLLRGVVLRIAVSAAAKHTVERHFPGDYVILPNGISAARFRRRLPRPPEMADATRHVLFVGRIEPRKGLNDLIDAMAIVARAYRSIRLVVVGDGPDRAAAESRARDAGADIRFLGRVSDEQLPAYYQAADVVCSPAIRDESFGIVLLEALAAGRPVVATDIAGYRELVLNGADGLVTLTPVADLPRLAAAIVSSLEDAALLSRAKTAGPAFAARFDWREIAGRLTAQYAAVLGGHRRTTC